MPYAYHDQSPLPIQGKSCYGIASGSEFKSVYGTEQINLREDITKRTNIYNINDSGTAEIIAFREHDGDGAVFAQRFLEKRFSLFWLHA